MERIAFKALLHREGKLYSPLHPLVWEREHDPLLGEVIAARLPARWDNPSEPGWGIHASTHFHACRFANSPYAGLFLVAPHPNAFVIQMGESLWKADHVVLVERVTSVRYAARRILDAHAAGYRQMPAILDWANAILWDVLPKGRREQLWREAPRWIAQELINCRPMLRRQIKQFLGVPHMRRTPIVALDDDETLVRDGIVYVSANFVRSLL